jgi:Ca2+-binding RTX toxin-like protein
MEDRCVPANFLSSAGDIMIYGTEGSDSVTVRQELNGVTVFENFKSTYYSNVHAWGGDVYFVGYGGNDWFTTDAVRRITAYGMGGNDTLIGGGFDDTLSGGYGEDWLYGNAGNDTMYGADGWSEADNSNNYLFGGFGHDTLRGGSQYDALFGEDGYDCLYGNSGNDQLDGGGWMDYLEGGIGQDTLLGGDGDDDLNGGDDGYFDVLIGGAGNDWFQIDYTGSVVNSDRPSDFKTGDRMYNNS